MRQRFNSNHGGRLTSPVFAVAVGLFTASLTAAAEPPPAQAFFPIGLWLQAPANAARYQSAGINTYVGLWEGPTARQLDQLQNSGLKIVCAQNEAALSHSVRSNIIAWTLPDEPDNSRAWGARLGRGSPMAPEALAAQAREIKSRDPNRPVLLNLGQGLVWNNWYGRGRRNGYSEDYSRYVESCDIASFDIYPVNHPDPEVRGNLWFVAEGVARLRALTANRKPVWSFIECTAIHRPDQRPTADQVRAQVWMAIIHGANGIVYFAHRFEPSFEEAALLSDPEMLAAVTKINQEVTQLAPVLNRPAVTNAVSAQSEPARTPLAWSARETDSALYIFAVAMRPGKCTGSFKVHDSNYNVGRGATVLGENRSLILNNGWFTDDFGPWQVRLYRIDKLSAVPLSP